MKTKNGKGGIFAALAATLLITTALIPSCSGPAGGSSSDGYQPGMGKVKLTIDGIGVQQPVNSRSILPSTAIAFAEYDLTFQRYTNDTYGTTDGSAIAYAALTPSQAAADIALEPGYWEVEVVAYTTGPTAAAAGVERFIINAGVRTDVIVGVGPNITAGGDGTFTYSVDLADLFDKDDLDFTAVTGNATLEMTIAIIANGSQPILPYTDGVARDISTGFNPAAATPVYDVGDTIPLPVGYYRVTIELKVDNDFIVSAGGPQILHIYDGLDSEYDYIYKNGQLYGYQGDFDVTTDLRPELETSLNGGTAALFDPDVDGQDIFGDELSITAGGTSDKLEITVTNADKFTAISWYANSATPLTTAQGVSAAVTGVSIEGETLTITAGTAPFAIPRIYHVTVEGTTPGGVPYSTGFRVVIAH